MEKSSRLAVPLYFLSLAILFVATIRWLLLPQTAAGTLGTIAAYGGASLIPFVLLVRRYSVPDIGGFLYRRRGPFEFFAAILGVVIVSLLMSLGVVALRFGDPPAFTVIGMFIIGVWNCLMLKLATTESRRMSRRM